MKRILLIANNPFSKVLNNGKTFHALLSKYDREHLAQIFFDFNNQPDFDICSRYYRITDVDVIKALIGRVADGAMSEPAPATESPSNSSKSLFRWAKKMVTPAVRDMLWCSGRWKSPALDKWIDDYCPDVVFYVGGPYGFSSNVARYAASRAGIPMVVYYTDDYVVRSVKPGLLYPLEKARLNRIFKRTLMPSSLRYVIGEEMADAYADYFGMDFKYVMNSVDIPPFSPKQGPASATKQISYFGGLHLKRWATIMKLASHLPTGCQVNVYTFESDEEVLSKLRGCGVKVHSGIQGEQLAKAMADSDYLLHVESDDAHYRRLTSLSVSTKIPEYLVACRPIIAVGPTEVASLKLISRNGLGHVVSSECSEADFKAAIRHILDKDDDSELVRKGYDFAKANFDKDAISLMIYNQLESL